MANTFRILIALRGLDMTDKEYTVTYYDEEGPVEIKLTINHMADFFVQARGFPSILTLGSLNLESSFFY